MANKKFWDLLKKFNTLMDSSIQGPNCTDPNLCSGDCCSIEIDVPKVLAQQYIKEGYAMKSDFIRSDIFSFKLRFDEKTGKCFLFNADINGCSVHESGIKPPQCWIYPTKFETRNNQEIKCKKLGGWRIIYPNKASLAGKILNYYNFLCQLEAKKELKSLKYRINSFNFEARLKTIAPSHLGGFIDRWDNLEILPADGLSLQMKKICVRFNESCKLIKQGKFLDCSSICKVVSAKLKSFVIEIIPNLVSCEGADTEGKYPLYKLFNFGKLYSKWE